MSDLVRCSFSIDQGLHDRLEELIGRSTYDNRSEFIRDLIRERLVQEEWAADAETVGTVTLIYDHHTHGLTERLQHLQHHHHQEVLASTHVHLDHHLCAEMILLRGRAGVIRLLADGMRRLKGVLHAALSLGSTGKDLR